MNQVENCKIFDTKGFLDTEDEINNQKDGGSPQEMVLKALETVGCIAEEGVNAVLLVLKLDRISQAEGDFARKTLKRIFGHECQEKILLVITNCEDNLVEKPEDQKKWLDQNAKDAGSNFKNYFALVSKNPEKVIFVNNTNPASVVKEMKKKYCLEENQVMAQKIFGSIQNNECFKAKAYLSENIMALKEDLEEEAKKVKEMKSREDVFRKKIEEHENVTAKDREEIEKLNEALEELKLEYAKLQKSFQQKFQDYKKSILGEEGLGAIPIKIKQVCSAIAEGVQKIGEGLVTGIAKGLASLKFW